MNVRLSILVRAGLAFLSILLSGASFAQSESDRDVKARKIALEVAGAFTNDGFKMRDGHWCGGLKPHDLALIAVNLYAGNQYWFSVGAIDPAKKVAINVYDESGKQVTTENYSEGEKAAAGFSPTSSGQYFVSVDLIEGNESNFCLVYSYK
ncbi:MAG TPA: hypothetical protein VIV62_07910 [Chthoniobacterales bacterium]|jgi:hypothetical protein